MSDQPIIIEESSTTYIKPPHQVNTDILFYDLLDEVEQYDSLATKIRKLHQQATLNLASVKFVDPFSLFPSAHRCLPAFLTISQNGKLQHGYVPFTQQIDEDLYFEEFDEQVEIQKECLHKQSLRLQQGHNSREQEKFIEKELLYRFNVLNQQDKIIATAKKFTQLLSQLLKLADKKREVATKFSKLEQKGTK